MDFKIPFTVFEIDRLRKTSKFFSSKLRYKKESKLGEYLRDAEVGVTREEYLGICMKSFTISFLVLFMISSTIMFFFSIRNFFLYSIAIGFMFGTFIYFSQRIYPRIFIQRKQREIEKNLVSALEDILIQLNSGIPLFNILVNISDASYGVLSNEFRGAVKKINAGEPESEVLDYLGKKNPSVYFRRTLWQISNGMRSGADISAIISESIKTLNEEQLIQIQSYGSKLNPMVVLYMLIAVIVPSLSVAFLTIVTSLVGLDERSIMGLFIALFVLDVFAQVMFLGLIKSRRPSLL